jgi:hypothetical protein
MASISYPAGRRTGCPGIAAMEERAQNGVLLR